MIKIVEATCSLSKSRGDQLLVTDSVPFTIVAVNVLTGAPQGTAPFELSEAELASRPLAGDPALGTQLFGVLLPAIAEDAPETFYEVRWRSPHAQGGVVFEIDR